MPIVLESDAHEPESLDQIIDSLDPYPDEMSFRAGYRCRPPRHVRQRFRRQRLSQGIPRLGRALPAVPVRSPGRKGIEGRFLRYLLDHQHRHQGRRQAGCREDPGHQESVEGSRGRWSFKRLPDHVPGRAACAGKARAAASRCLPACGGAVHRRSRAIAAGDHLQTKPSRCEGTADTAFSRPGSMSSTRAPTGR